MNIVKKIETTPFGEFKGITLCFGEDDDWKDTIEKALEGEDGPVALQLHVRVPNELKDWYLNDMKGE